MYFAFKPMLYLTPLLLAFLFIVFIVAFRNKRKRLELFVDKKLIPSMIDPNTFKFKRLKALFLFLSFVFFFLALSRPQWGAKLEKVTRKGLDIIVAVDTSLSMAAEDFSPNRLEKAKHEIASLIDILKGDRIGILTFAGTSFMQCPLTMDYDAAKMYLDLINFNSIPVPGTAIAKAIKTAIKSFNQKELKHKVLILITDGGDHEGSPLEEAKNAKKAGIVIYTIGIGSTSGEPIPVRDENGNLNGYKKDKQGNVVMSRLDETTLEKIALTTGGKYYHASSGELELKKIYEDIGKMEKKKLKSSMLNKYQDKFDWFLIPGLIFLLLEMFLPERTLRRKK